MRDHGRVAKATELNHRRQPSEESGQSLMELALVLPLVLLLAFGTTELGRAYYQYNTLSKAIRDGARYVSSHTYSTTNIGRAQNLVVYGQTVGSSTPALPGLTTDMILVNPSGGTGPYDEINPPQSVTVKVNNYPFSPLVPSVINLNVTFSPEVMFRYVGPNARF
jgi:Flp pilus assembly protein TadG